MIADGNQTFRVRWIRRVGFGRLRLRSGPARRRSFRRSTRPVPSRQRRLTVSRGRQFRFGIFRFVAALLPIDFTPEPFPLD